VKPEQAKRIQRSLYVHSTAIYGLLKSCLKGVKTKQKSRVLESVWMAYQHLVEHCLQTSTKTLITDIRERADERLTEEINRAKEMEYSYQH
jgi:hypothetical protein